MVDDDEGVARELEKAKRLPGRAGRLQRVRKNRRSAAVAGAAYLVDQDGESALDPGPVIGVADPDALALVRPVVVLEAGKEVVA